MLYLFVKMGVMWIIKRSYIDNFLRSGERNTFCFLPASKSGGDILANAKNSL